MTGYTISESERRTEQRKATRALRKKNPGCLCWVETFIVNNGTQHARLENKTETHWNCRVCN